VIRVTIGGIGRPEIKVTNHVTGEEVTKVFPLYRTKATGRWYGKPTGMPYQTPDDRQHILNEARQFADGFLAGYEYARSCIERVDDSRVTVKFDVNDPFFVRQHAESERNKA